MSTKTYLPETDKEKSVWLKNFAAKFAVYATQLGFLAADVTAIANDSAFFTWVLDLLEAFRTGTKDRTKYKNILRDGPLGTTLGAVPTAPAIAAAPTAVAAGVFPRISSYVKRIKAHPNYTEAIGQDMGIIGTDISFMSDDEDKPTLVTKKVGGVIQIKYVKGTADGIYLFSRRGSETEFSSLGVVTKTTYKDDRPNLIPGQPEKREYYAWFMKKDQKIGQESDTVSIVG
ncbi:MAG: hypothetical protein K2Q22_10710 [Cytophagales bacterium]|nr:hypothetical protein [Cytophagales bacterium]